MSRNKRQQKNRQQADYVTGLLNGKIKNRNPSIFALENGALTKAEILEQEGLICRKLNIDYSVFSKTDIEKSTLKMAKRDHAKFILQAGLNPKSRLNVTSPMTIPVQ